MHHTGRIDQRPEETSFKTQRNQGRLDKYPEHGYGNSIQTVPSYRPRCQPRKNRQDKRPGQPLPENHRQITTQAIKAVDGKEKYSEEKTERQPFVDSAAG